MERKKRRSLRRNGAVHRVCVLTLLGLLFTSCVGALPEGRATWDQERYGEIVTQNLDNSCGLAALLTIMRYHFHDVRFDEQKLFAEFVQHATTEQLGKAMKEGLSLVELEQLAASVGYTVRRKRFDMQELERTATYAPVLVFLRIGALPHFAVVRGVSKDIVWLADPARGNVYHTRSTFLGEWASPESQTDGSAYVGLVLAPATDTDESTFLQEPIPGVPPSLHEIQRGMMGR